jgi:hypothetical protein
VCVCASVRACVRWVCTCACDTKRGGWLLCPEVREMCWASSKESACRGKRSVVITNQDSPSQWLEAWDILALAEEWPQPATVYFFSLSCLSHLSKWGSAVVNLAFALLLSSVVRDEKSEVMLFWGGWENEKHCQIQFPLVFIALQLYFLGGKWLKDSAVNHKSRIYKQLWCKIPLSCQNIAITFKSNLLNLNPLLQYICPTMHLLFVSQLF